MDKVLSIRDLVPLIKRQSGKTTELVDVIVNFLYNECKGSYAVICPNIAILDNIRRLINDGCVNLGVKLLRSNRQRIENTNKVTIHLFTADQVNNIHGLTFDDVFFENPEFLLDMNTIVTLLHRMAHENIS